MDDTFHGEGTRGERIEPKISYTKVGAKPRDGSSNLMMFGRRMQASFRQRIYLKKGYRPCNALFRRRKVCVDKADITQLEKSF
jgi:hypothetical protein